MRRVSRTGSWLIGLASLLVASSASGAAGEHGVVMGLGYQRVPWKFGGASDGMGGFLGYRYGFADDWNLQASAGATGFLNPGRRFSLLTATVGVSYLVDALSFVPEVRAGIGYVGPLTGGAVKPDLGLMGGVALEYRRVRPLGVGVAAEYRFLVRNRGEVRGVLSAMLYVARYF